MMSNIPYYHTPEQILHICGRKNFDFYLKIGLEIPDVYIIIGM